MNAEARPRTAFAAWREQVGLTRREVAAALGITAAMITCLEQLWVVG